MKKHVLLTLAILSASVMCAEAADAKAVYAKECAKCHGVDGKGGTKMGQKLAVKDFTDAKRQAAMTDEAAFKAIKSGVKDGAKTVMKASDDLTDEQIKDLVSYVRKFKK
jgi:mono/diheme cytochrome c family protein